MFMQATTRKWIAVLTIAVLIAGLAKCYVSANEGHAGHQHGQGGHNQTGQGRARHKSHHGGQLSETKDYCVEVVYRPKETRVYLYDHNQEHLSVRGVGGEAAMQIRDNDHVYRFPANYVAATTPGDHDYLSVAADVSRIRDGDMKVTFVLNGLPNAAAPGASFTQTFALSKTSSTVTVTPLIDSDRAGIARQAICPVMGTPLGDHGTPIKLLVYNQPLFVCCKGCIGKVQEEPQTYLTKLDSSRSN